MIDLVIRGGTVIDGTGADPVRADVAIEGDRIAAVGAVPPLDATELDAAGLYVTPGFIDVHSHSDYTLLIDPRARSAVHQGVTLEVVGNCGFGCFPIRDPELARKAIYGYSPDVALDWRTAGEYFERLEAARPAVNVVSLVPNGQLRLSTVGLADRPAAAAEATAMADLLRESLGEGAWGYSTGLEYAQEAGATEEEVTGLCHALGPSGGLYATHTRRRDEGASDSVSEAIRSARAAGVRLQVSHLVPRNGIEESRRSMQLVDEARAGGMDIEFDMHTRLYGLTHLYAALPPWALAEQGDALTALLGDPAARDRMRPHRSVLSAGGNWERIVLLDNPFWPQYARRDIASVAAERGQEPLDAVYDLLAGSVEAPQQVMVLIHAYTADEQREAIRPPAVRSRGRTRRRSRPTARSPTRGSTAPPPGRRGSITSWFATSGPARPGRGGAQAHRPAGRPPLACQGRGVLAPGAASPTSSPSTRSRSPSAGRRSSRTSSPTASRT